MLLGADAIGEVAIAHTTDANFVNSKVAQLLDDPGTQRVHLLEATPYDPNADAETTIRLSDVGFETGPSASAANKAYEPRLTNPFNFESQLFRGGSILGGSQPSFGAIKIANPDGGLDNLADYFWDDRSVKILLGTPDSSYDEFETIFQGRAETLSWTEQEMSISLRDPRTQIEKPVQETVYAGTGGNEGGEDLEDTPKPLAFGEVRNVKAVLVDNVDLVYQVHDGSVDDITAIKDRGVQLTDEGDTGSIQTASVSAGSFKTDLSKGLFKLGARPDGTITADVKGDNSGGYVNTVANVVERIVKDQGGLTDSDLDLASFADMERLSTAVMGFAVPNEERQIPAVLDEILTSASGFWTFTREGKLKIGRLRVPGAPKLTLTDADIFGDGVQRESPGRVIWRVRIGYDRSWTIQEKGAQDGALAASLTQNEKERLSKAFRYAKDEDSSIKTEHKLARSIQRDTLIVSRADASSEATRLLNMLGVQRDLYRVPIGWRVYKFDLNDNVEIDLSRFGLSGGKRFRVIGVIEDAGRNRAELLVWG